MRTTRPSISALAALTVLILSMTLVACAGGGGSDTDTDSGQRAVEQPAGGDGGGEQVSGEAPLAPDVDGTPGGGVGASIDDARIVRTGTMELEVKDVESALTLARDGMRTLGGYIGASNTYDEGGRPTATITYRVPVDRWEDALDLLRDLSGQTTRVVTEQTQAVEVTGAVADLEARIRNLRASEAALQEIAAKAVRVSDVLEVQGQLTQVRGEIESMTAQLKDLEDRADLATLTATFRVPVVAVEVAQEEWDPAAVVDAASASLINVLQTIAGAGIWFAIVWLPVLVAVAVLTLVVVWIVRRLGIVRPRGRGGDAAVS
jgi:hypothetical protein